MTHPSIARKIKSSLPYAVEAKVSGIEGRGLFARSFIRARRKVGEMRGEIVSEREANRRARTRRRIAIVELGDGRAVDAARGNEFRYINHSCSPNTYIRVCYSRVEFYALRNIRRGEELTCDYGDSHHEGKLPCKCGSKQCRGFI